MLCRRLKNVLFEMSSTDSSGVFDVNAKFMGVSMDKVQLLFQVTGHLSDMPPRLNHVAPHSVDYFSIIGIKATHSSQNHILTYEV